MHTDARGYAYETFRDGGRVCRRYVGSGPGAAAALRLDALDRQRESDKRKQTASQIGQAAKGTLELKDFCALCDELFRSAMDAGGYHQHKRGQWRKARNPMPKSPAKKLETLSPIVAAMSPEKRERFDQLKRAQSDPNAAAAVFAELKGTPEEREALELFAPFSKPAREQLISLRTKDELSKEGFGASWI